MKIKARYQEMIRAYGVKRFCDDHKIRMRWLYLVFNGTRYGREIVEIRYDKLRDLAKALGVSTDALLE